MLLRQGMEMMLLLLTRCVWSQIRGGRLLTLVTPLPIFSESIGFNEHQLLHLSNQHEVLL